jgi:hypothetical protein
LPDESVAAPVRCLDELRGFRVVIERSAQLSYTNLQHPVGHVCLWPHGFDQFLFRHQLARMAHQVEQDGELFRRQSNGLLTAPETLIDKVETESSEDDLLF